MDDIKTEALKLIVEKAEEFTWSDDFLDLLGRNKDLRIDVFKTMAAHKTIKAVEHEADDVIELIRVFESQLRERLGEQFKSKVKELNSTIKEKQNELNAALAEKDTLQKRPESAEGIEKQTGSHGSVQPSIFANGGSLFAVPHQTSEAGVSSFFGTCSTTGKFS
jgi:hypothetical protein